MDKLTQISDAKITAKEILKGDQAAIFSFYFIELLLGQECISLFFFFFALVDLMFTFTDLLHFYTVLTMQTSLSSVFDTLFLPDLKQKCNRTLTASLHFCESSFLVTVRTPFHNNFGSKFGL